MDYLLRKWERKGWWDYGTGLTYGWFTDDAPIVLDMPEHLIPKTL